MEGLLWGRVSVSVFVETHGVVFESVDSRTCVWPFLPARPAHSHLPALPPSWVMRLFQALPSASVTHLPWNSDSTALLSRTPCLFQPNFPSSEFLYTDSVSLPEFSVVPCVFDLHPIPAPGPSSRLGPRRHTLSKPLGEGPVFSRRHFWRQAILRGIP